jgi:hypothetical protein
MQLTHAVRNKAVAEKWRLRLHESVRMLCNILDSGLWSSVAILNRDVASDAIYYKDTVALTLGDFRVVFPAENFYALAGCLGYEGDAFTGPDDFFSPNAAEKIHLSRGTELNVGECARAPPPPAVLRAEYARIHVFGDSMTHFLRGGKSGGYTRVAAYLSSFHFHNLTDHSSRGAKVKDISMQMRKFFGIWEPKDLEGTKAPAAMAGHFTNKVPPADKRDGEGQDEYYSPSRSQIDRLGRPRPVFLDSDVAARR